jgi:hypothetical protein
VLNKEALVNVSDVLLDRATVALGEISFNLDIVAVDVTLIIENTPQGARPVWLILYQAKGLLLGNENNVTQITGFGSPFVTDEEMCMGLSQGCDMLRTQRAKQGNGIKKGL